MKISSPAFKYGETIPLKYTCEGENVNPELIIDLIPDGTKSIVLIVEDPDAPSGTWTHWIMYNIKPDLTKIPENATVGKQGVSTSDTLGYSGPCPPGNEKHRYFFRIYALDAMLQISDGLSREQIDTMILPHIIDSAEIMGYFSRKR